MENNYIPLYLYDNGIWVKNVNGFILKTNKFSKQVGYIDKINRKFNKNIVDLFRPMTQQECFEHGKEIQKMLNNRKLIKQNVS
jgi:hypothetical protein